MNKRILGLAALPLAVLPLTACQQNTGSTEQNAKSPAVLEDTQLKADGYSPFHVPGFGKFDVGIRGHSYEAVVYTGKLTQQVVYSAEKKPQPGITITGKGTVVTVTAGSLSQLKDGVENVAKSFLTRADGSGKPFGRGNRRPASGGVSRLGSALHGRPSSVAQLVRLPRA